MLHVYIYTFFCLQKYSGRYVIAKKLPLETGKNAFALLISKAFQKQPREFLVVYGRFSEMK